MDTRIQGPLISLTKLYPLKILYISFVSLRPLRTIIAHQSDPHVLFTIPCGWIDAKFHFPIDSRVMRAYFWWFLGVEVACSHVHFLDFTWWELVVWALVWVSNFVVVWVGLGHLGRRHGMVVLGGHSDVSIRLRHLTCVHTTLASLFFVASIVRIRYRIFSSLHPLFLVQFSSRTLDIWTVVAAVRELLLVGDHHLLLNVLVAPLRVLPLTALKSRLAGTLDDCIIGAAMTPLFTVSSHIRRGVSSVISWSRVLWWLVEIESIVTLFAWGSGHVSDRTSVLTLLWVAISHEAVVSCIQLKLFG